MIELSINDLILLVYLTNYDIQIILNCLKDKKNRDEVFSALYEFKRISEKEINIAVRDTKSAIDKLKYYDIKAIPFYSENYPKSLKNISTFPPILYVKGKVEFPEKLSAVIGSRDVSKYAEKVTNQIVKWLEEEGFGVVSGLALGIDTFAHKHSCKNNIYNLAVLPHSLDSIYPKENYGLASEILDMGGSLVSENIFNINRGKRSFVQRNRIQAALSSVIIPVEMGINSGTMHTVNFAKRYSKKVLVFEPTEMLKQLPQYEGINSLIESKKDILLFNNYLSFKASIDKDLDKKEQSQTRMDM
ncbi:DNA-processing protein DprA [Ulvibacter litoralis]|uniref:DNA processing protein n=1 Tax=Ulvibacter litoralis TaxID=227084 RepID=A0A1G7HFV8_9FLAO|nr:DNA-processing protein DprA [Ulvibacter litoralis]GHC57647.1 hypothetical protein GCM10008083_22790 [Ulvibacter litoralis]SDE99193.1 DNA processing protein [Ulvibacter litoralis]